mgnify:CR=1 FL=1
MPDLTPEQRLAVHLDCPRLLVSASAGTGKTHVLTQRYLRLVLERGTEVTQIVAVTFTEAAAAEMRCRIAQALRTRLQSSDTSAQAGWLRRQILLLERAPISTLHSFCLRLVREFFFLLELDPDFTVLDAAEAELWKRDVLEKTLESWFEQCPAGIEESAFYRLVDEYGGLLAGEQLPRLILELHAFLNTLPDPENWWQDVLSLYGDPEPQTAATERLRRVWQSIPSDQHADAVKELRELSPLIKVLHALHAAFRQAYWQRKLARACLDFDDLEQLTWKLLCQYPRVCAELRRRYRHILVDEYQDINPLQNAILERLHGNDEQQGNHWFMVGDIKQSIYGFRLACPALFQEKVMRYYRLTPEGSATSESLPQLQGRVSEGWVSLTANFRSRRTVLEAVNYIFEQIAATGPFGMPYDESARLRFASAYYDLTNVTVPEEPVWLHLLPGRGAEEEPDGEQTATDELSDWERLENEAVVAAHLIRQWVSQQVVWDTQQERFRPAEFRDVAILMRTVRGRAETVVQTLRQQGIPVHAELRRGFWEALEVRDVLAVLQLLRNPFDDVPLAAVLRSPLVGLSAADLAQIRLAQRDGPFYLAVHSYAQQFDNEVAKRLRNFLDQLESWRDRAFRQPIARLLWDIYRQTGYLAFVQGLPDGAARLANLILLHDRARQFETRLGGGLEGFLHYLDRLREHEQDCGAATASVPAENVVRLMSIHQSKGLEFPIVVVLDLGNIFNEESLQGLLLFHRELLLGAKMQDRLGVYRWPSRLYEQIRARLREDLLAEELRLLYVAMTRARECLALIGSHNHLTQPDRNGAAEAGIVADQAGNRERKSLGQVEQGAGRAARPGSGSYDEIPPPEQIRSPLQWLLPVFARAVSQRSVLGLRRWQSEEIAALRRATETADDATNPPDRWDPLEASEVSQLRKSTHAEIGPLMAETLRRVTWQYPHQAATRLPGKTSPTRWRMWLQLDADTVTWPEAVYRFRKVPAPAFVATNRPALSAVERGQLTHRLLRHLDLRRRPADVEELRRQLAELQQRGLFTTTEAAAVDLESVAAFFTRPLGQRLCQAVRRRCEVPFSLIVSAREMPGLEGLLSLSPADIQHLSGESILVQGVMDVLFWESRHSAPVLLDYKTDELSPEQVKQAAESYRPQLSLYARAITEALGEPCREIWVVFLAARQDVRLA